MWRCVDFWASYKTPSFAAKMVPYGGVSCTRGRSECGRRGVLTLLFSQRCSQVNNFKSNYSQLKRIFDGNKLMMKDLSDLCPTFRLILAYILEDRIGFQVKKVKWTMDMTEWGEEESQRVGRALATFIRKRKTGDAGIDAWRLHYPQVRSEHRPSAKRNITARRQSFSYVSIFSKISIFGKS